MRAAALAQPALPGPRAVPLLGPRGGLVRFFRDPLGCMRHLRRQYGDVAAVSRGDASLVCAFGPELNRQVLSAPDRFHNAAELPVPVPPGSAFERVSSALVARNGDQHRKLRRAMLPLLQRGQLERYRSDIVRTTEQALAGWQPGQTMNLSAAMAELSLRVAFRCFFGLDIGGESASLARLAAGFTSRATALRVMLFPFSLPGTPYRRFLHGCEDMEARLLEVIRARRAEPGERRDALAVLTGLTDEDGAPLADELLVGLASELFIAGHETTQRTLAWTLFLLDRHPQVLADVRDELAGTLGGEAPTLDQLAHLPLLDAVVKESMRVLGATPFLFFRRSQAPVTLGGYELPAGARVIISPFMTHHQADLYPEPARFRPARWTDAAPGPFEYLPFGAGPRVCLGLPFATMSLRLMLSLIVQRFRPRVPAGADVSYKVRGIVLATRAGMPVRLERTDGPLAAPAPIRGNLRDLVELPA